MPALPPIFRPALAFSKLDKLFQHAFFPARKGGNHFPICLRKPLPFFAVGADARLLKPYRLVLQLQKAVHKYGTALLVKAVADTVKRLVVKMLD